MCKDKSLSDLKIFFQKSGKKYLLAVPPPFANSG